LLVVENTPLFYAPNAFTPDQDGLNEVFLPVYLGYVDNSWLMRIYDRWGILIFESRDPSEGWMGNINGGNHFAQNDVYQWQIELKDASRPDYVRYTGHVTLIR
jgi:gliding motility-associated-like protein